MSKGIKRLYTSKGLTPPKGKGIHTKKFHDMATSIKRDNPGMSMESAYAISMKKLGRNKAVKRSHWRMKRRNK